MEGQLNITDIYYKDIEEYELNINNVIESMISKNERLVFAVAAERAGIDPFIIRKYPDLRNYIINRIMYYKEIQVINNKIEKAVNTLMKSNKPLTFISIVNKCKFSGNTVYQNQYIKEKIRSTLAENKNAKKNNL